MKKIGLAVLSLIICSGCVSKTDKKDLLPNSYGRMGSLAVVIENDLWKGKVGDVVRDIFAAEAIGLPQVEPVFSILQMPSSAFTGYTKNYRNALIIKKGENVTFGISEDKNASPQKLVYVIDTTEAKIIENLKAQQKKIIETFKENDVKESWGRFRGTPYEKSDVSETFNIDMLLTSLYETKRKEDNFMWLQKEIKEGSQNILIYELPKGFIQYKDSAAVGEIIRMRDSIGFSFIPGRLENTHMITEEAYAPYVFDAILDNKPTIETRGTWEVKGDFMAGPFLNYIIHDDINNRQLVLEGFVFAPSVEKRNFMLELEAILRSVRIRK
ncbi:DUF4837 family protein [Spongiivirga citrea]|uniref:DUF4837 family protein n=1 Tax=Spongiivirga citrea TaxID=1481457 RepID=A0A6M0CLT9_9FLAO|nr:DUF4837 family protein [Spongiivirga citrea]NER18896.1 DUF4837 family protein [Spongiivirga citrea]